VRWVAPIDKPGNVIGIGLNYSDHALESGMPIPGSRYFHGGTNTVVGRYDNILIPRNTLSKLAPGEKIDFVYM
jgi:2,4-didehydro-3-deoxy-L-rhamnonate hydrolase